MSENRFDAEHPDNMPAYFANDVAFAADWLWNPRNSIDEWDTIRARDAEYPRQVGYDPQVGRLQLPIGFDEWWRLRDHPCWPEYREQMNAVPTGQAVGFDDWFAGVTVAGTRCGPRRPFPCDASTKLPPGWVRGDPASTHSELPIMQLAHNPLRHLVVRRLDPPTAATRQRMRDAGFDVIASHDNGLPEATYFVRDRATAARSARPQRAAAAGRGL